jgi:hypothetical protein
LEARLGFFDINLFGNMVISPFTGLCCIALANVWLSGSSGDCEITTANPKL